MTGWSVNGWPAGDSEDSAGHQYIGHQIDIKQVISWVNYSIKDVQCTLF